MKQLKKIFTEIGNVDVSNLTERSKLAILRGISDWRRGLLTRGVVSAENQFTVLVDALRQNNIYVSDLMVTNLRRLENYAETLSDSENKDEMAQKNLLNLQASVHKLAMAAEALMDEEIEAYQAALVKLQATLNDQNLHPELLAKGRAVEARIRQVKEHVPPMRAILIEVAARTHRVVSHPEDTDNLHVYANLSQKITQQSSYTRELVGAMVMLIGGVLLVTSVLLLASYIGVGLGGALILAGIGLWWSGQPKNALDQSMSNLTHAAYRHQI